MGLVRPGRFLLDSMEGVVLEDLPEPEDIPESEDEDEEKEEQPETEEETESQKFARKMGWAE